MVLIVNILKKYLKKLNDVKMSDKLFSNYDQIFDRKKLLITETDISEDSQIVLGKTYKMYRQLLKKYM